MSTGVTRAYTHMLTLSVIIYSMNMLTSVFYSIEMEFRTNVKTVSALMDQFYEKRRLLIVSTPSLMNQEYRLQNLMIQVTSSAHMSHRIRS